LRTRVLSNNEVIPLSPVLVYIGIKKIPLDNREGHKIKNLLGQHK
jgi:hypothetical protein